MTSFWHFSVALCLTGLGLGDSPLMILSLCSLALSCVFSIFSFLFLFPLSFPFVIFSLPYVFLHKVVFFNIYLFIYQKKSCNQTDYIVDTFSDFSWIVILSNILGIQML